MGLGQKSLTVSSCGGADVCVNVGRYRWVGVGWEREGPILDRV